MKLMSFEKMFRRVSVILLNKVVTRLASSIFKKKYIWDCENR